MISSIDSVILSLPLVEKLPTPKNTIKYTILMEYYGEIMLLGTDMYE